MICNKCPGLDIQYVLLVGEKTTTAAVQLPPRFCDAKCRRPACFDTQVGHIHAGCSKEVTVTFCSKQSVTLSGQLIKCKICQVQFKEPLDQVVDWDDRKRTVQWLDSPRLTPVTPEPHGKNKVGLLSAVHKVMQTLPVNQLALAGTAVRSGLQVINTDPEPSCTVVPDTQWDLELCIKAVCDYVQFSCITEAIHFNDTMLYQSRIYQ